MKLLNKNRLSVYPDEILVSDVYNGVIVESANIQKKLYYERTMVYESVDSTINSYYQINGGVINLSSDYTVIEFVSESNDIVLQETPISELTIGSFIADSSVINELEDVKEDLMNIGFTSEAVAMHKILNGLDDDFRLPLPVIVTDIKLIETPIDGKQIEFENTNPIDTFVDVIYIDDVAVKVK